MLSESVPRWPDHPALFLDLDGTLIDFALDPAQAQVPSRVSTVLELLPAATNGAIAFVSGRTISDLDRLLGAQRFPLAAIHGLERRDSAGQVFRADIDAAEIDTVSRLLEQISSEFPGTMVEHKDLTLALHYRRCPEIEAELIARVDERLAGVAARLKLMHGKCVLEFKPESGNKGTAISAFMQEEPFRGRVPVFIGDDVTDEDGFMAVNDSGGISVKVGSGATQAAYRLPDSNAVIDWLERLARRVNS